VRSNETVCPHCAAGLALPGPRRTVTTAWSDARRLLAAAALAGIGTACAGAVADDPSAIPAATESDVLGSCAPGAQSSGCNAKACSCGPAGFCSTDGCTRLTCGAGEYLNQSGECVSVFWFDGRMPTSGACYGCPPRRIGRQNGRAT
jgi:hypothetical protein